MKFIGRRKHVEIYFILYLAALIFLLPDRGDYLAKNDEERIPLKYPFSLQPEKTALTCKMAKDSSGYRIVEIDSVNKIFYSGNAKNVNFEFTVINQSLQASLDLTADKPFSEYFRIEERPDLNAAFFFWQPPRPVRNNITYLVEVKAYVSPKPGEENSESENLPVYKTQFSLSVVLVRGAGEPLIAANDDSLTENQNPYTMFNPFVPSNIRPSNIVYLNPRQAKITPKAYTGWSMTIWANNINLKEEILKGPIIEVNLQKQNSGGSAKISQITENAIILEGKTPGFGSMEVKVSLVRVRDVENRKLEAETSFIVEPAQLPTPDYPREMYPGITYSIKPEVDVELNARVILRGNSRILVETLGNNFSYTPEIDDIGKTFTLERYIDTAKFDEYYIKVLNFEDPKIVEIRPKNDNYIEVKTLSHGKLSTGRNEIDRFIVDGNAEYSELRGVINSTDPLYTEQVFKFWPKNPDAPFRFSITAVDDRGRKSEKKSYN